MSGFRIPYRPWPSAGPTALVPLLPLTLHGPQPVAVTGLVDSGAAVSVLPWAVGLHFGVDWDQLPVPLRLAGNLALTAAKLVMVRGTVGPFPPVLLSFAWTKSDAVPVILGQINFFVEFDVCFFRSAAEFEVRPAGVP